MRGYKVKVLADSISPDGVRISAIAYQAPRPLLAEINTHRAVTKSEDTGVVLEEDLSRNAESSRAISFNAKLARVSLSPYFPEDLPDGELMGESKGMQATAPMNPANKAEGQRLFRELASLASDYARRIADEGFHKQDVNRLLEPFSYTRGVISATEMANFFALRCDWRAYPPFRFLARCVWVALSRSTPKPLGWGDWHLPFITDLDRGEANQRGEFLNRETGEPPRGFTSWADCLLARWSAARCARVSYYQFGTKAVNWDKDGELYDRLAGDFPLHASPLEHPAFCGAPGSLQRGFPLSNFRAPWVQLRKFVAGENISEFKPTTTDVAGWNIPEDVFAGEPGDW